MCSLQFARKDYRCQADLTGHCSFDCVACKYESKEMLERFRYWFHKLTKN